MYNEYQNVKKWLSEQKKGSRIWLLLLTAVVTIYLVILLWLIPQMMEAIPMDTKYWKVKMLAAVLMLVPVFCGLLWGAFRCRNVRLRLAAGQGTAVEEKPGKKRLWLWFLFGFAVVFLWLMVYYYAYFPGSFDWDNLDQWWQIQNHQYDTWHPVFHTLIIALSSKIVSHYGFAVFMQLLLYSLICSYLIYTMAKWRFPK